MNLPPRLRFKLEKFKASLRETFAAKEENYDTSHRMCPHCRGLISRDASVCPLCDTPLRSPRARSGTGAPAGRVMGGLIPIPSTATSVIVVANIALYGISWYLTQQAAMPGEGGGDISGPVLLRLGAKFGPYMIFGHQWWRLVTAIFLHGGLLHIGMNLWCLFDLGPEVESLFSTPKFIVLYLFTGVFGFIISLFWSLFWSPGGLSIGASGSIVGLIGILIGASYHHGTLGKDYRRRLWLWVAYILVLAILPFPIDNAAHIGGLVSGLALGYFIPEGEPSTRAEETLWNALALLAVLVIAGSFTLMALQLNLYR
jgi:membrane associated rhomboid family serine protease